MTSGSQEKNKATLPAAGFLILQVKVQPRSSRRRILFTGETECRIWIHTAPEKGKANKEVIRMLADHFGIAISQLRVIRGETARHKRIEVKLTAPSAQQTHASEGKIT
jgi:uncharacterized protein (TIGR00251 family)